MEYHVAKPAELVERPREKAWSIDDCAEIVLAAAQQGTVYLSPNGSLPSTMQKRIRRGADYVGALVRIRSAVGGGLLVDAKWPVLARPGGRSDPSFRPATTRPRRR